jgi:hypothetical protein
MAELRKAAGVNADLIEELVKKHFGADFTSKIAWDFIRNRFVPSDLPRRLVSPQRILGIRIWWKSIGEFTDNLGFRLELWDPTSLRQARAFVEEYNQRTKGTKIELYPVPMYWPASSPRVAA